ncbi:type VII secretion protein EccB [Mycolicibacterium parafortuitum]|uniref:Type VII secretion protein EccB n=1 Tax=Mycolicibacterium parafortuitum TaxID=39692 RepID=A0A375YHA2_MYCPF|nr:type VII secretion protein EccB [Mycolicibacterium parafortuitum]ORB28791.1 type VII secretion protein EccB [Mycolicibacterium parafortuitum]SRX80424.1 hypothetical protein MPP7335_02167 [Mycolicibacterium parafortuitum]
MGDPRARLQLSGHRFLAHRMAHALVRGDTGMLDDPLRTQSISLAAGAVAAVIAVAVCAVLAVLRPGGSLGDARIVVVRESGAVYVRVDDVMHPVFNLASARLVLGEAAAPRVVSQRALERTATGSQLGIPGAPEQISPPLGTEQAQWTVCDGQQGATVTAGPAAGAATVAGNVLVTPRGESAALTYLLHDGRRSRVDLRHSAVVRALKLDGVVPQAVSPELLAAVPEAPAIVPPHIPGRGAAGPGILRDQPVGAVVTVARADGGAGDFYVVLDGGLQRIGEVAADLIRFTGPQAGAGVPAVASDVVGAVPVVTSLPVGTYPEHAGVVTEAVVCAVWSPERGQDGSHTRIRVGAQAPAGPTVPTGRSLFVRSVGLTGGGHSSGSLFLVTDTGTRYGIRDAGTATALGLPDDPVPAPWPVLALLPAGPELSRDAALRTGTSPPPQPSR